ncbi:hypothetical protein BDW22DRAFT_1427101 [Trametopsis cervina]|nr:hypothetical protein BDW22DRAFT_1427101 [Trametopsis cervina]
MDMRQIPNFLSNQDWRDPSIIDKMADSYLRVYTAHCRQALQVLPAQGDALNCARFKRGFEEELKAIIFQAGILAAKCRTKYVQLEQPLVSLFTKVTIHFDKIEFDLNDLRDIAFAVQPAPDNMWGDRWWTYPAIARRTADMHPAADHWWWSFVNLPIEVIELTDSEDEDGGSTKLDSDSNDDL